MIERNVLQQLMKWKDNIDRKPLILRGARQVGKTTIVNIFAQQFDQYLYLNLDRVEDNRIFNSEYSFEEILKAIFFYKKATANKEKSTLIFIDEVQNSSVAVAMMRYFYEDAKNLFVIAAGSLLESLLDTYISFPVGRVEYMFMYPLTFAEFVKATQGPEVLDMLGILPVPDLAHERLLKIFHQYTLLGGMPEVIENHSQGKDIISLEPIYQNLMLGYMDDVEKYAANRNAAGVIRHVIERAPFEAGKRIKFHGFGQSNYGSREAKEALLALEKALILHLIYPTTSVMPPVIPNYKKAPKLQFLDTGLINYVTGLQKYYFELSDLHAFYQGVIAEHIVGQELIASDFMPLGKMNFWIRESSQSTAEVDFVVPHEKFIIPIEVKSGKTGALRSLHQFMEQVDHDFAVRLYSGQISLDKVSTRSGKEFRLLSLPYYLTFKLVDYIEEYMN